MPDVPRRLFCIPLDIPSKYLPLALYAFLSLFSGPSLDNAISIAIGYLYFSGYFDKLKPTSYYLEGLEQQGNLFYSLSRSKGWVLSGTLGHDAWISVNENAVNNSNFNDNSINVNNNNSGGEEQKDLVKINISLL
jgi:hypothetical protein